MTFNSGRYHWRWHGEALAGDLNYRRVHWNSCPVRRRYWLWTHFSCCGVTGRPVTQATPLGSHIRMRKLPMTQKKAFRSASASTGCTHWPSFTAENCGHFQTRIGVYRSGCERMSWSDLTSGQISRMQVRVSVDSWWGTAKSEKKSKNND